MPLTAAPTLLSSSMSRLSASKSSSTEIESGRGRGGGEREEEGREKEEEELSTGRNGKVRSRKGSLLNTYCRDTWDKPFLYTRFRVQEVPCTCECMTPTETSPAPISGSHQWHASGLPDWRRQRPTRLEAPAAYQTGGTSGPDPPVEFTAVHLLQGSMARLGSALLCTRH